MKATLIAMLAVTLVAVPACGRNRQAASSHVPAAIATTGAGYEEDVVTGVVADWIDAIKKQDVARINAALADDFSATLPDGGTTTKWEHIKDLQTGRYVIESMSIDRVEARVFGDTAIVTYEQTEESQTRGSDQYKGRTAWTDVLLNRDGRWQIVAEHGSQLPS